MRHVCDILCDIFATRLATFLPDPVREHADDLIDDIAAELRFNLRKKDPASRRRIMRTYGVKFRYLKGEPVEAE